MGGHALTPVLRPRRPLLGLPAAVLAFLFAAATPSAWPQGTSDNGIGGVMIGAQLVSPKQGPPPPGIGPMYQAYVIVTGTDMRERPRGFAQCLREVLVKVSGNPRLKNDPRTALLAEHADRFVVAFNYVDQMAADPLHDEQGTYDRPYKLTVYFEPARIDAVLAGFGERPWHGARPVIVPVILVRGPKPPAYVLSAEIPAGAEQRGALAYVATQFGMTVHVPTQADLAAWGISSVHFPPSTAEPPASRTSDETIVLGTLEWSETLPGWIGKWRAQWHGAEHAWGVSGVSYDAAFSDIVRGVVLLASGNGAPE